MGLLRAYEPSDGTFSSTSARATPPNYTSTFRTAKFCEVSLRALVASTLPQVLMEHTPNISDLPKFLSNQMRSEARRSRAHRGIECRAEFSKVGNIWAAPLLPQ